MNEKKEKGQMKIEKKETEENEQNNAIKEENVVENIKNNKRKRI